MRPAAAVLLLLSAAAAGPETARLAEGPRVRRARLAAFLERDYALVLGQPLTDVLQPRQEGHFLYLTGAEDPGAALLLAGEKARALPGKVRSIVFLRGEEPRFAQFYGLRLVPGDPAARRLAVDSALPAPKSADALADFLAKALPKRARLHLPAYAGADHAPVREIRRGIVAGLRERCPDVRLLDLHPQLSLMRAVKDDGEIAALEEAVRITLESLREALPAIRDGSSEAAVDGLLLDGVRKRGALPAYPFVVAGGANSCFPHYFRNEAALRAGDILLIDAGGAVRRYAADITRTFPVSGTFTDRQREVYDAVLRAQRAAIRAVRPGATLLSVHAAARAVLEQAGLAQHFIHGTSHHVGLDVHDPGAPRLEPGMTITVEPGVYIEAESIGVRIEDIVLVTPEGSRVLSDGFPKDPEEIEALLRAARD